MLYSLPDGLKGMQAQSLSWSIHGLQEKDGALHHPLFGPPRGLAVDAVRVDLLLEKFFHLVRFRDVDGQLAVVVHRRDVGAVVQQVSGKSGAMLVASVVWYRSNISLLLGLEEL